MTDAPLATGNIFRAFATNPLTYTPFTDPLKEGDLDLWVETDKQQLTGFSYKIVHGAHMEETGPIDAKTYRTHIFDWGDPVLITITPYIDETPQTNLKQVLNYNLFRLTSRAALSAEFQRTRKAYQAIENTPTSQGLAMIPVYTRGFKILCLACYDPSGGGADPKCEYCHGTGAVSGIHVYLRSSGPPRVVLRKSSESREFQDMGLRAKVPATIEVVELPYMRQGDYFIARSAVAFGYEIWKVEENTSFPTGGLLGIQSLRVTAVDSPDLQDNVTNSSLWLELAEQYL